MQKKGVHLIDHVLSNDCAGYIMHNVLRKKVFIT